MKSKPITILMVTGMLSFSGSVIAEDDVFEGMSFFVTSQGMGDGADLGGLEGADAHCEALAKEVGVGHRTWRAYLSTESDDGRGVSARQRIGMGPWYNADGILIATNPHDLHTYNTTINKYTALDEHGDTVNGVGDSPNQHDILTGSMSDGMAFFPDDKDHTCDNWTSNGEGSAMVGHTDRHGGGNVSWNAAHPSAGCSQQALRNTGGAGKFYCFAAD